jgi:hypothetical protein
MVGMSYVQAATAGPGGQLYKMLACLDIGCSIECCSEEWFLEHWHRFIYPGSTAKLCELRKPVGIGMFAGRQTCQATHCVVDLPLHIGDGVYPVNLLIVNGGNFNLVLGNSFFYTYAVRLWSQDYKDKQQGRYLVLPLPPSRCAPGVTSPKPPPRPGAHWYPQQRVPIHYDVCTDTLSVTQVSEYRAV